MAGNEWVCEHLAKLNPHGAQWDIGRGGRSGYSRTEIAGSLQGVKPLPMLLLWAQYVQAEGVQGRLEYEATSAVHKMAVEDGWRIPRAWRGREVLRKMGRLAVMELTLPAKCALCRGTGGRKADCVRCGGSGNRRVSERERARTIGIPWATWGRVWQDRYVQVRRYFAAMSADGLDQIRKNIRP